MSLLFSPFTFHTPGGPLTLSNRIVVAPMCQYASTEGQANDWHLAHWTQLLNSGAGMVTLEHVSAVEALISAWNGQGALNLPGGVKVERISGRLSLSAQP